MNSQEYSMYVRASNLSLGDRDYYLKDDKRNKEIREAYKKLIERQMINSGYKKRMLNGLLKMF